MDVLRTVARAIALVAIALAATFGATLASATAAGAQLEPITDQFPGGDDAPEEEAPEEEAPEDDGGSGLPEELDPLLGPILDQLPGGEDDTPEDDGSFADEGSVIDDPAGEQGTGAGAASTLPQTGGVGMVGAACAAAAGGLALRRLLSR